MSGYIPDWLRQLVVARAEERCEYCLIPQLATFVSHQIDHVIAQKHGGLTKSENLALTCAICNRFKGSDIVSIDPDTGEIVALYHPCRQIWVEHFLLRDGWIQPVSTTGRVTVFLLQMNRPDRVTERRLLYSVGVLRIPGSVGQTTE